MSGQRVLDIEFIVLGNDNFPGIETSNYPRSLPTAAKLYQSKVDAIKKVTKPYFCFLDGGEDSLPVDFLDRCESMCGSSISYGDEIIVDKLYVGEDFSKEALRRNKLLIHHAPICHTDTALSFEWPIGCFWFESLCYHRLARISYTYHPGVHYIWNPSPNGARLWPDTVRARINSGIFMSGGKGVHFTTEII